MGFTQMLQNRAVARETNRPFIEQMERYQEFWADVFHDMVEITLRFAEQYNKKYQSGFETTEVEVTFESPLLIPADEIAAAIKAITDSANAGVCDAGVAQRAVDWLVSMINKTFSFIYGYSKERGSPIKKLIMRRNPSPTTIKINPPPHIKNR